jgi:integrase
MLTYFDPVTNKKAGKSSGTHDRREAERRAALLEKELREGKHATAGRLSWAEFTRRYRVDVLRGLAASTRRQLATVFATVDRLLSPKRLRDLTAARLASVSARLLEEGKSAFTVRNYLAHLRAALKWAVDVGLLSVLPKFPRVKTIKGDKSKGRAISAEEFERMLAKVPAALMASKSRRKRKPAAADAKPRRKGPTAERKPPADEVLAAWRFYLKGLWWSGLRLAESLNLYWEPQPGKLSVDLSGKYPMLRIPGECQKNGKGELCPVAPEFGEMLLAVPAELRRGRVFKLIGVGRGKAGLGPVFDAGHVGHVVGLIGWAAGVKVQTRSKPGKDGRSVETVKFASAHDLRRSFGFRWSRRVMPAELRELMRHADISTTMAFYVGRNAQTTAESLWTAYRDSKPAAGNTFGNTSPAPSSCDGQETTQAVVYQRLGEYTTQDSNL